MITYYTTVAGLIERFVLVEFMLIVAGWLVVRLISNLSHRMRRI